MDERLLAYYNSELRYVREMAGEFAREFPKIAGRLALDRDAKDICPDPYVERLLEGFAFLAARVHLKLDAEFPRFTQTLLETVFPHYLSPVPSMCIVRFEPDPREPGPEDGFLLERGTALRGQSDETPCQFRTAHDVRLWPLKITDARYYTRTIVELDLPGSLGPRAAFPFVFRQPAARNSKSSSWIGCLFSFGASMRSRFGFSSRYLHGGRMSFCNR